MTYLITSLSLSLTSYFMLFRPSVNLLQEILNTEDTAYNGVQGFLIWNMLATVFSPVALISLLKNNNTKIIETIATGLADREIDEE